MKKFINLIITTALMLILYSILTPYAFSERGYQAVGGEWIIIIGLPAAYFISTWQELSTKKRRLRREHVARRFK